MTHQKKNPINGSHADNKRVVSVQATPNLVIEFWPTSGILHLSWRGEVNGRIVKEEGRKIPKLLKAYKAVKVLNDNTLVKGKWNTVASYVIEEWFPEMFSAGLQYFAWVFPYEYHARISARDAKPDHEFVREFLNKESAYTWLRRAATTAQAENKMKSEAVENISPEFKKLFVEELPAGSYSTVAFFEQAAMAVLDPEGQRRLAVEKIRLLKAMCEALQLVNEHYGNVDERLELDNKNYDAALVRLGAADIPMPQATKRKAFDALLKVYDDYFTFCHKAIGFGR